MYLKLKLKQKRRFNLREAIILILGHENRPLTNSELLEEMQELYLNFKPSISLIRRYLSKLHHLGSIEFVYLDQKYGVKLTKKGKQQYELIFDYVQF